MKNESGQGELKQDREASNAIPLPSRVDFVLVFSVDNANPNGDPGYDNRPRTDAYTGIGFVTDVCIKRKIRNRVEMIKELGDGYDIWVRSGTYLKDTVNDAVAQIRKEADYPKDKADAGAKERYERQQICRRFYDIRAFGGVLTSDSDSGEEGGSDSGATGKLKSRVGQIRGPVSIQYAKSVVPIVVEDDEITRVCPTKFDPKKPEKKTEMGRKKRVPFGVYVLKGSISARLAEKEKGTGFSDADLALLKEALATLFDGDQSTARPAGSMVVQKLVFFFHSSKDGNEPVHRTLDRIRVDLKPEFRDRPDKVRAMDAYGYSLDTSALNGIRQETIVDNWPPVPDQSAVAY